MVSVANLSGMDEERFNPVQGMVRRQRVRGTRIQQAQQLRREMTEAECILWDQLRANRLVGLHFRRQQIIGAFFADFYCHAAGIVVEVDGEVHAQQTEYDQARDEQLASLGLCVLRFSNDDIRDRFPFVLESIASVCIERMRQSEQ